MSEIPQTRLTVGQTCTATLDDVEVTAYTPDERVILTRPDWRHWPVSTLETILTVLRKKGKCCIRVELGPSEDVPTVAEILYGK